MGYEIMSKSKIINTQLGWIGSALGLLGAALLAINLPISGYGWIAFLASNVAWIIYGLRTKTTSLLVMQIGFTITSVVGMYRWLV